MMTPSVPSTYQMLMNAELDPKRVRQARSFASALVATGADSDQCALCAATTQSGEEYHILLVVPVGPRQADELGEKALRLHTQEFRFYKWNRFVKAIKRFYEGATLDELAEMEISANS